MYIIHYTILNIHTLHRWYKTSEEANDSDAMFTRTPPFLNPIYLCTHICIQIYNIYIQFKRIHTRDTS